MTRRGSRACYRAAHAVPPSRTLRERSRGPGTRSSMSVRRGTSRPPRRLGSGHQRNSDHGSHRRHLRQQGRPAAGRARRRPRRYSVAMEPGRRWGRPAAPPVPAAPRHLDRRPVTGCTAGLGDTPRCRGYRTTMGTRSRKPTGGASPSARRPIGPTPAPAVLGRHETASCVGTTPACIGARPGITTWTVLRLWCDGPVRRVRDLCRNRPRPQGPGGR